ncbi:metal ABC transporter ATP-binding protein [Desulfobulbus oligotrophicus]|uniref:metal ABC transporter ATP-binding protein n=1 Tax=Desulfobulbus oligotrophicus TaxID=1909699 RepID=UPI001E48E80D|nr:metal ABC transporter ATP-binding protein [Desulfobulbus oligotrophicus]MDY0390087.1 metal ABC transporter ATP-binding protein [Desulfobulbus oligotrophicus]
MAATEDLLIAPSVEAAVRFEGVTVERGGVLILDQVSATVPKGSCTAIIGPNGSGKTTLLLALLGEIDYQGHIIVRCNESTPRIGYVPQRLHFDRGMPLTVSEFLAMGFQKHPLWFGVAGVFRQQARERLAQVKAEHVLDRQIGALSGGELQRVLLALALQQEPDLLVLDEPSAGVDFQGELVFCEVLDDLRRQKGFTLLMVSHDLATVTHHATHVICLNRRVAAEGPPRHTLTNENLTAIFGMHMGLVNSRSMPDDRAQCSAPCCQEHVDA